MRGMPFPALGVVNRFLLGDTAISETIARHLAEDVNGVERGYIVSNYPELFIGHPTVTGVRSFSELPAHARVIDLSDSIKSIEADEHGQKIALRDKFGRMCRQAGFDRALDRPRLYLTPSEWMIVDELKHTFPKNLNVGVVLGSAHGAKNWLYMQRGIKKLRDEGHNVFVFAGKLTRAQDLTLPKGIYHVIGRSLRTMMQYLAAMDVMMGVDTGPMHVAGALGVPLVVVCFSVFADLYDMYDNAVILDTKSYSLTKGITGVSIKQVLDAVAEMQHVQRTDPPVWYTRLEASAMRHAYIRIRGIGDLFLTLPAIATEKSLNGNSRHSYTYITSGPGKIILDETDIFDEVIAVKYDHPPAGFPLPPQGIDYSDYDTVTNLINTVDFLPSSDSIPRTELFGRAIGVEQIDYTTNWKLTVPRQWKEEAWEILAKHGVEDTDTIIALQVDTKGLSRSWPKPRQVEFCGMCNKRRWKVVLLSDIEHYKYPKSAINLTGKLSIQEYIGIIAISSVGVSPDSALAHIAGCTDKQAVVLFGAVDPELRIKHYTSVKPIVGTAKKCRNRDGSHKFCNDWQKASCNKESRWPVCMWSIKPQEVIKAVEESLGGGL